jgi:hypothetical protein
MPYFSRLPRYVYALCAKHGRSYRVRKDGSGTCSECCIDAHLSKPERRKRAKYLCWQREKGRSRRVENERPKEVAP